MQKSKDWWRGRRSKRISRKFCGWLFAVCSFSRYITASSFVSHPKFGIATRTNQHRHQHQHHHHPLSRLDSWSSLSSTTTAMEETKATTTSTLTFRVHFTLSSEPAKALDKDTIWNFFQESKHRNLLVTAGGTHPPSEPLAVVTNDLLEEWKNAASRIGATEPTGVEGETLIKTVAGAIQFPGLTVTSNTLVGSKLDVSPMSNLPVYEFVLLRDEQSLEGLAPMVWFFKQVTGRHDVNSSSSNNNTINTTKESGSQTSVRSLSTVTAEINESTKELRFLLACKLEIDIQLSSFILRLLPVSKETVEKRGSAAVMTALKADAVKGITTFRDAYEALLYNR